MTPGSSREKRRPLPRQGILGHDDADDENVAYLKQLSREVAALEMLRHELLERNARLERWHSEHPSGVSSAPESSSSQQQAAGPHGDGAAGARGSCGEAPAQPPSLLPAASRPRRVPQATQSPSSGWGALRALPI